MFHHHGGLDALGTSRCRLPHDASNGSDQAGLTEGWAIQPKDCYKKNNHAQNQAPAPHNSVCTQKANVMTSHSIQNVVETNGSFPSFILTAEAARSRWLNSMRDFQMNA